MKACFSEALLACLIVCIPVSAQAVKREATQPMKMALEFQTAGVPSPRYFSVPSAGGTFTGSLSWIFKLAEQPLRARFEIEALHKPSGVLHLSLRAAGFAADSNEPGEPQWTDLGHYSVSLVDGEVVRNPQFGEFGLSYIRVVPAQSPLPLAPLVASMPASMMILSMEEEVRGSWRVKLLNSSSKDIYVLAARPPGARKGFSMSEAYGSALIPAGSTTQYTLGVEPIKPGERRSSAEIEAARQFFLSAVYSDGSCEGEPDICAELLVRREARRVEASWELEVIKKALERDDVAKMLQILSEMPSDEETHLYLERHLATCGGFRDQDGNVRLSPGLSEIHSLRFQLNQRIRGLTSSSDTDTIRTVLKTHLLQCEQILSLP